MALVVKADASAAAAPSAEPELDHDDLTLFSLRRPKNVTAGAASGVKSALKGVTMGAVGLLAAPIVGAKEGGAKGFVQGLGTGILGAVCLPVAGVVVGGVQVARGLINTPEAIMERAQGKVWDEEKRVWIKFELDAEARELLGQSEEEWCRANHVSIDGKHGREGGRSGKVAETELYDVLGVAPSASEGEIRKAYYKLAREKHPDKCRDPSQMQHAHETFQKIGEAYQVLSNEEFRAKYDESGRGGLDVSVVDSMQFFSMLFGSEPFEYLFGELKAATMFSLGGTTGTLDMKYLAYKQKKRIVLCAVTLRDLLRMFELGDEKEFEEEMHAHAAALHAAPMGEALLWTCGYVYEHKGLQALGGIEGFSSGWRQSVHDAGSTLRIAGAAYSTWRAARKELKKEAEKEKEEADKKAKLEKEAEKKAKQEMKQAQASADAEAPEADTASSATGEGEAKGKANKGGGQANASAAKASEGGAKANEGGAKANESGAKANEGGAKEKASASAGKANASGATDSEGGATASEGAAVKLHPPGTRVVLHGLVSKPELNGSSGAVVAWEESKQRYTVLLDGAEAPMSVKPECLHLEPAEAEGMTKPMLLMAETIWRFSLQDIESTLRQVCNRVLSDSQAEVRSKRARALVVMGRVFRSYGSPVLKLAPTDLEKHFASVGEQFAKAHAEKVHAEDEAMYGKKHA